MRLPTRLPMSYCSRPSLLVELDPSINVIGGNGGEKVDIL